jgi:GntR family transcriptional regulator/MocR family aminotransferase
VRTDDLPLHLDRATTRPLAVQLADELRSAAAAGVLRPGDRLPSTRALATRLGVSRTVTAAAYEQLVAEGWAAGRHGSGTFVTAAPPSPDVVPARAQTTTPTVHNGRSVVDIRMGSPWTAGIDRAAWRRAWRAAADAPPLGRPVRGGLPEYGAAVVEHLLRHRGLACPPDAVLATSGTTSAVLELATSGVLPRGATVAMEEPGYARAVGAMRAAGLTVLPAPVDADGLDVGRLPSGVAAVYCTPAHQYPLGGRLPAGRRLALVGRARAEGFLVIEDDYDGELRYDVGALPVLAGLGPDVVVHLGTTSKILTPSLGVGWMVAPPAVRDVLLAHRDRTGTGAGPAGQRVFVALAGHGDLARHLRRLRRELAARRELLVGALAATGQPVSGDQAGAHVVVELPGAEAERATVRRLREHGVLCGGLADHYLATPDRFGLPIGYAGCSRADLPTVIGLVTGLVTGW